MALASFSLL